MVGRSGRYVGQIKCFGEVYLLCYTAYDHFSVQNVIFKLTFMPVKPDIWNNYQKEINIIFEMEQFIELLD